MQLHTLLEFDIISNQNSLLKIDCLNTIKQEYMYMHATGTRGRELGGSHGLMPVIALVC